MIGGSLVWLAPILLVLIGVTALFALRDRFPPRVRAVFDWIKPPREKRPARQRAHQIGGADLERLNALCRGGRNAWLSLLFVCVFAGVTLMGVQDADFFIVERETVLPLVGVSVPTLLFFQFAPLVIAALYANLHFHLLKVWEALSDAPARCRDKPLSESLNASFIADLALAERNDGALQTRPMRVSTRILTWLLIFAAAPVLLGFFWWRSMPKHDELLTSVFCALPLCFALFIGLVSWHHMRHQARGWAETFGHMRATVLAVVLTVPSLLLGSFATAGLLYHRLLAWGMEEVSRDNIDGWPYTPLLAKANLAGVAFTQLPPDWVSYDKAPVHFGRQYCTERELPTILCTILEEGRDGELLTSLQRAACQYGGLTATSGQTCEDTVKRVQRELDGYWNTAYREALSALPRRDLSRVDFRGANLGAAKMQGVDLRFAEMQGGNLGGADLQGANLGAAEVQGAVFWGAKMQGANLVRAGMQNADVSNAKLQNAQMQGAQLSYAVLSRANMQSTDLRVADLSYVTMTDTTFEGADMRGIKIQEAHGQWAEIQGAQFASTDLQTSGFTLEQLSSAFGDATVVLPDGHTPGEGDLLHWAKGELDKGPGFFATRPPTSDYTRAYQAWLDTLPETSD